MGVEGYEKARIDVQDIVANHAEYKENFHRKFIHKPCHMMKYENGLKDLIYMMQKDLDDIKILQDALNILVRKQKGYRGEKYNFGPIIMRAFHYLNMPDVAIKVSGLFS